MMKKQIDKTKRNRFNPRRQQGNTLVPVVIGLGIAAVATAGFLNQSADLTAKANANLAINEITQYLSIYNTFRSGGMSVEDAIDNIPGLTDATSNSYGKTNGETETTITFPTDSIDDCELLSDLMPGAANLDGVSSYTCNNNATTPEATSTLTLTFD